MNEWKPNLKRYPHFDKYLPEEEILRIVSDPQRVAANSFFPFILYDQITERFGRTSKGRPIRYAARRDAYIFSYYRHVLSALYEEKLQKLGISDHPIAYRKIPVQASSNIGKCNIHFAKESFIKILEMGSCYAIALDISGYFESLDHSKLELLWIELLNMKELPADHKAVFNAITKYAVVDRDQCYERLGYIGEVEVNGIKKRGFTINPRAIPMQLCSMKDFRDKICGADKNYPKLIKQNKDNFGIPQGSPMSDLLANIYLINFDKEMSDFSRKIGAYYRRYSDDILLICPAAPEMLCMAIDKIKSCIQKSGDHLQIKDSKTNITQFSIGCGTLISTTIQPSNKQKPFEYLGFAFDGYVVKLRDSTTSKYYRKMTFGIRKEAENLVARYPGKTPEEIVERANLIPLYQQYGRIDEFNNSSSYEEWNFWTYTKRSADIMQPLNNIILHQLRNHKKKIVSLLEQEVEKQFVRRLEKQMKII